MLPGEVLISLAIALVAQHAVLIDPAQALTEAERAAEAGGAHLQLRAAETALLAGRPERTLEILERLELEIEDERTRIHRARLELDALVILGRDEAARRTVERLEKNPGWENHAWRALGVIDSNAERRWIAKLFATAFALAIGALAVSAGRELLRVRKPVLISAVFAAASIGLAAIASPLIAQVVALVELAWVALMHAATSAAERITPVPRFRLFVAALLLIGLVSAAIAVLAPLPVSFYIEALARG